MVLDEIDAADEGALAEQGGLRAFHDLDALHVVDGEVRGVARVADGHAVLEQGDARRTAVGDHTAQRVARRVEALCLNLKAGDEVAEVFDVVSSQFVDHVLIGHRDVDRNVDERLFLFLGGNRHDIEAARLIGGVGICESGHLAGESDCCNGGCSPEMKFHE